MATVQLRVEETYATLVDQPFHTPEQISIIKKLLELYIVAFVDKDFNRTAELVHPDYKQHNPLVGDGWKSIIEFGQVMEQRVALLSPIKEVQPVEIKYKHIFVVGDFVTVHCHCIRWPGDRGLNVIDLYRFRMGNSPSIEMQSPRFQSTARIATVYSRCPSWCYSGTVY